MRNWYVGDCANRYGQPPSHSTGSTAKKMLLELLDLTSRRILTNFLIITTNDQWYISKCCSIPHLGSATYFAMALQIYPTADEAFEIAIQINISTLIISSAKGSLNCQLPLLGASASNLVEASIASNNQVIAPNHMWVPRQSEDYSFNPLIHLCTNKTRSKLQEGV